MSSKFKNLRYSLGGNMGETASGKVESAAPAVLEGGLCHVHNQLA
jgi:hypothetical protein